MCAGGPGSIPGTDNLDSGFHPFVVGKMTSSQHVVGDRKIQYNRQVSYMFCELINFELDEGSAYTLLSIAHCSYTEHS